MNKSVQEQVKRARQSHNAASELVEIVFKNGRPSTDNLWLVSDLILNYYLNHRDPRVREDMQKLMRYARQERNNAKNKHSSTKDKSLRRLGVMPEQYLVSITQIYGDRLPIPLKQFRREFFKRYPKFRIADKI